MEKFLEISDIFVNELLQLIEESGICNIQQSSFAPDVLFTLEVNREQHQKIQSKQLKSTIKTL